MNVHQMTMEPRLCHGYGMQQCINTSIFVRALPASGTYIFLREPTFAEDKTLSRSMLLRGAAVDHWQCIE